MPDPVLSPKPESPGFSWLQKITAAIGAISVLLLALKGMLLLVPDTVDATKKAAAAVGFMHAPAVLPGMQGPDEAKLPAPPQPPQVAGSGETSTTSGLGPKPGPNCHVVMFNDSSTFPPKTTLSWKC